MNAPARVCPWQFAWTLDNPIRKLIQNPYKIVGKYIEEGQTVLDLGCGPGMFSIAMADLVGEKGKVIAVDIQEEMLALLKKKREHAGLESRITIHKSQSDKMGVSEKVDFALAFYMIHEVPDKESFLKDIAFILKPKARFLIVEPKFHVSKFSFEETLKFAESTGLKRISEPKIFFSRAVLLQQSFS